MFLLGVDDTPSLENATHVPARSPMGELRNILNTHSYEATRKCATRSMTERFSVTGKTYPVAQPR
jgi:hypothetical protein